MKKLAMLNHRVGVLSGSGVVASRFSYLSGGPLRLASLPHRIAAQGFSGSYLFLAAGTARRVELEPCAALSDPVGKTPKATARTAGTCGSYQGSTLCDPL